MSRPGRPLRFLAVALGGWTTVRLATVWPSVDSAASLIHALAPPVAAATLPATAVPTVAAVHPAPTSIRPMAAHALPRGARSPSPEARRATPTLDRAVTPTVVATRDDAADAPRQPPPLRPVSLPTPPDRWAGSAWLIARGGRADALATGQLGASQAGARLTYALGHRVALAARLSAPLAGRGAETAFGVDWQPTHAPIHVVAEQRITLDGGRGGTTLMVIGGLDPTPVALGFSLDAYGQAGGIHRDGGVIGFADGAARLARPVLRRGSTRLELGAGAWGGAQPGATRLDLGPSAALVTPIGGRAVRVSLDWRQRVAGHARPGSGPALSIGGDF